MAIQALISRVRALKTVTTVIDEYVKVQILKLSTSCELFLSGLVGRLAWRACLNSWSLGCACASESWTRAGYLAAKILRKHARTLSVIKLARVPRAFLRIFHRDDPTRHIALGLD